MASVIPVFLLEWLLRGWGLRRVLKVDPFQFNGKRTMLNLRMDGADILAKDQWRNAHRKTAPEQKLVADRACASECGQSCDIHDALNVGINGCEFLEPCRRRTGGRIVAARCVVAIPTVDVRIC